MQHEVRQMHQRQLGHLNGTQLADLTTLLKKLRKPHEDSSCDWLDDSPSGDQGQQEKTQGEFHR